jgi:subtilase family serine protease
MFRASCLLGLFLSLLGTAAFAAPLPFDAPDFAGVRDLGPAPASVTVRVAVVLRDHHDAELEQLVAAQADPESPLFHHFLTAAQYAAYFAPTPSEYAQVVSALQRGGWRVTHEFANRTVVDAVAPASLAAKYFATEIHRILSPAGEIAYANVRPGTVPAEIGSLVLSVQGLDAIHRMHPQYLLSPRGAIRSVPAWLPSPPVYGPDGGYGPIAYINSYDLPAAHGNVGQGRASGVATDSDFFDSDLASFIAHFGIRRSGPRTTRVAVDGGTTVNVDAIETTLDVETIVSLAPGTALYVYLAPYDEPTNANFIDIYNQAVSDNLVDTMNTSYGYCELAIGKGYPESVNAIFKQGNALGITFHEGSGDWGIDWVGCRTPHVSAPADSPHTVAIGGTVLSIDSHGNETSEVGWGGSGGGYSVLFGVPAYQKTVKNVIRAGRNVPDLAFNAIGSSFYFDGGWAGPISGTSLASPIFGAALTEIDSVEHSRAGDFTTTLYKIWRARGYGAGAKARLRDITQGINGYPALPGYDQVTGIGSVLANNLIKVP